MHRDDAPALRGRRVAPAYVDGSSFSRKNQSRRLGAFRTAQLAQMRAHCAIVCSRDESRTDRRVAVKATAQATQRGGTATAPIVMA
jgi:hypothetical protein